MDLGGKNIRRACSFECRWSRRVLVSKSEESLPFYRNRPSGGVGRIRRQRIRRAYPMRVPEEQGISEKGEGK